MTDFGERADRLKEARSARGLPTARAAADFLGIPYGTYSGHENGSRGIKDADILRYASAFRVSASWLAFGQEISSKRARIIGVASTLSDMDSDQQLLEREVMLPFPVTSSARAIVVSTKNYSPILSENDVVLIGELASVVQLQGSRIAFGYQEKILLGTLLTASRNDFIHVQLFDNTVLLDIQPDWAAPIIGVIYQRD